jgi:hypothetical protein
MKTVGAAIAVLAFVSVACGGSGNKPTGAAADATLKIRDAAAAVQTKAASGFAGATDGQALALGDTVKTNGTGFAQVNYRDGSLTRLDANAQFTLSDLSTASQTQRVVGTLDGGRAWSNVQKVTSSDGRYEIDTSVATASVRGTRFNTDCTAADRSCTFTVIDGTVSVTPTGGAPIDLHAGQALTVRPDRTSTPPSTLTPDQIRQDPWIRKNLAVDTSEPLPSPSSSSASGNNAGAPLTVDACSLLSDAEVTAYANSLGGNYKVVPPLAARPTPVALGGPTTDPARQHFCTWEFDQTNGDATDSGGTVSVKVERLAPNDAQTCVLTNAVPVSGVGGDAAYTADTALACVVVSDVYIELGFGGAEENPTAPGDGVVVETLRTLARKVGNG